jgi:DsbC/DsbD-like thiol-disulfide interchange protein
MKVVFRVATTALMLAAFAVTAHAQLKKSDTVVKGEARAEKIADDGTQVVKINLTIDKGWHLYANPVGNEDLAENQVTASVKSKNKLQDVKVEYPAGTLVKDKTVGDYKVYEGTVTIKATVRRAKGDVEPLDVTVKLQACSKTQCLLPATITLTAK